jgi:hypothetical protein
MSRTTATFIAAVLLAAGTAGCSSAGDSSPRATATVRATRTPELSAADQRAACVDAWAEVVDARPDSWDGDTDEDVEPKECGGLPADDHQLMYLEGVMQRNQENRDKMKRARDWEEAWDQTDSGQQEVVCDRLLADGPEIVGEEMAESSGDDVDEQIEMAQYLLDQMC